MNRNKIAAFMLCLGLASLAEGTLAQPVANNPVFCTKLTGSISPGTVAPNQHRVIYGPYTVKCGTTSHHFSVKGASGQVPIVLQQLKGGGWSAVTGPTYDPSGRFGAGTFRLIIDNSSSSTSVSYTGSYTVPM